MRLAIAVAVAATAKVAVAQVGKDECLARTPKHVWCESRPGVPADCRAEFNDALLHERRDGLDIKMKFLGLLRVQARDVPLRPMAESVQKLQFRLRWLVQQYNDCRISVAEYQSREYALLDYHQAAKEEIERIDRLVGDLQSRQGRAGKRLDELDARVATLRQALAELSSAVSARLDQADRKLAENAKLAENVADFRQDLLIMRRQLETQISTLSEQASLSLDARVEELRNEFTAEVHSLREQVMSMIEGSLHERAFVLNLSSGATWLDRELHPSGTLSLETLRSDDGFLSRYSIFYEVCGLYWKREGNFNTFPGQSSTTFEQHASMLMGAVGLKRYFSFTVGIHAYLGLAGGLTAQRADHVRVGTVVEPLAGLALYFGPARVAIEARCRVLGAWSKYVEFDPFGDARSEYRFKGFTGTSIEALLSPFSW
jgi:hypothetical protein